jgi:rifampin ADP-ribosyltransferase
LPETAPDRLPAGRCGPSPYARHEAPPDVAPVRLVPTGREQAQRGFDDCLAFEDDPNLTDKKFPGNPTKSYRTKAPLRVLGELADWTGHAPEQLAAMKDGLARLVAQGVEAINE